MILGNPPAYWTGKYPLLGKIMALREVCWFNLETESFEAFRKTMPLGREDLLDAAERLERFRPYIARAFPETLKAQGLIESPLVEAQRMGNAMASLYGRELTGRFLVKLDSHLPIAGSIKARGGIYEVLKHAESLALERGLISMEDDYTLLDSEESRSFFGKYSIAVGSTGNLGLSIGIMGLRLGFKVSVHMSADAKGWKKDLLRKRGARVVEYQGDYGAAVSRGRKEAESDPRCHFVDDENSIDLFLGYAVAALRLREQLNDLEAVVDEDHPLFVYLPCGVGGGPGGITFGLKLLFGDGVRCFFAEPTHSPAMLLGLYTGYHDEIEVRDFGIDNLTAADGLAVGRPSGFVGRMLGPLIDGVFSVDDSRLYRILTLMAETEGIKLEPSALAGFPGILGVLENRDYIERRGLADKMENALHIAWATGGAMVPEEEMKSFVKRGKSILLEEIDLPANSPSFPGPMNSAAD